MNKIKSKINKDNIIISTTIIITIMLIIAPIVIKHIQHKKDLQTAFLITQADTKFKGYATLYSIDQFKEYIDLYDIEKFKEKEIAILTLEEIRNKKPKLLRDWKSLEEIKKNPKIDFSKNNKFFIYTRKKQ